MSDFSGEFWGIAIAAITVASIIACAALLKSMSVRPAAKDAPTTGHVWDEDLVEGNHPLPRWWIWLFYITIVFSLVYLVLYPGLGAHDGYFGWSSSGQYETERSQAEARYGPLYAKFSAQDLKQVAADAEARAIGQKLFLNHCAQCHGSDAGGARGFPSLRDGDWLYGGDPETIKASITNGRTGVMPALGPAVGGEEGARDLANYVLSLSGRPHDAGRASSGKGRFAICAACHGAEGKGNQQLGAPNLTDAVWLHGSSEAVIVETIVKGRKGEMPAHKAFLDDAKIHLLAAYVYSLSKEAADR
jgi:cytochrome c oxidase cbb3-type subunit 3